MSLELSDYFIFEVRTVPVLDVENKQSIFRFLVISSLQHSVLFKQLASSRLRRRSTSSSEPEIRDGGYVVIPHAVAIFGLFFCVY